VGKVREGKIAKRKDKTGWSNWIGEIRKDAIFGLQS
jgi:hypothetical protein